MDRSIPFRIGSDELPGLSKLVEEMGEAGQIIGKIMGLGSMGKHWDGTILRDELADELGDVIGAIDFIAENNAELDWERVLIRSRVKRARFQQWHDNIQADRDPNDGVHYGENERVPTRV
jgi:NTP pyrophosphatase (non-canonical NTP hydrolase)